MRKAVTAITAALMLLLCTVGIVQADSMSNAPGAGGFSPGGLNGNVQYNNAGSFGGYTDTQLTTHINAFTSALKGAVPASGGGTTNFLRADGTFAALPASNGIGGNGADGALTDPAEGGLPRSYSATTLTIAADTPYVSGTRFNATGTISITGILDETGYSPCGGAGGAGTVFAGGQTGFGPFPGEGGVVANQGGGGGGAVVPAGIVSHGNGGAAGATNGGSGFGAGLNGGTLTMANASGGGGGAGDGVTGTGGAGGIGGPCFCLAANGAITLANGASIVCSSNQGGDNGTTGGGGGGGGSGGSVFMFSTTSITTAAGSDVRTFGSAGGNGAGNGGGGGGGGGGVDYYCSPSNTLSGTSNQSGGAGGTKAGTGVNGTAGTSGYTVNVTGNPSVLLVERVTTDNRWTAWLNPNEHYYVSTVPVECQHLMHSSYDYICLLTGESPSNADGRHRDIADVLDIERRRIA